MKRILMAVDETIGTRNAFNIFVNICSCIRPEVIVLCYVEKYEGRSLITEMLGEAEMSTLKQVLEGTEYQAVLDKKANTVLSYYKKQLEDKGLTGIKTVIRKGHPAEEILKAAKDEKAEMIIIGSRGKRTTSFFMGSVSREVANNADIPVLIAR